jgi:hypothetical protein
VQASYPKLQYATFLTNHDIDRVFSTLAGSSGKMKQAAAIYLTLPGVPFVYYGEEVGMQGTGAHENIRRPMQWTAGQYSGFSSSVPWQSVGGNYLTNNVDVMRGDNTSIFNHYRSLIQLRNRFAPLRKGYLLQLTATEENILAYSRVYEDEAAIVVSNFNTIPGSITLTQLISSLPAGQYRVTEEMSGTDFGLITINDDGGFSDWQPSNGLLNPRETWVLSLSPVGPTSIEDQKNPDFKNISLSPNPCADQLHVEALDHLLMQVQVFDLRGTLLMSKIVSGQSVDLDVSDLVPGMYFIKVSDVDGKMVMTFVKG